MQIQYELLKHRQSEYLKAIYETRGKQRIHGKSLLTAANVILTTSPFMLHGINKPNKYFDGNDQQKQQQQLYQKQ